MLLINNSRALKRYRGIMDLEAAVLLKEKELQQMKDTHASLKTDYQTKRKLFDDLSREISIVEENANNISYGIYNRYYNYETAEEFKVKLSHIRSELLSLIKSELATKCDIEWTVSGSKKEGQKMIKQSSKLMLRAFNGECDAAIAKVNWNNVSNMEARIEKAYEAINKLGSTNKIFITESYKNLKLAELRLDFELSCKIQEEKEEQRAIREQMRDDERAVKEFERIQRQAEEEEIRYQNALDKAKEEVQNATGKQLNSLNEKIKQLEESLRIAKEQKQRAISQAQLTKSGHVYIISNIGSFGDNVYKVGMTRRADPMDRVKELGDASVPFEFDVHAIIYSNNAPELENILHKKLNANRVNCINTKKEFFNVSLGEIELLLKELNLEFRLTKMAQAREFRETQKMKLALSNTPTPDLTSVSDKFPTSLN